MCLYRVYNKPQLIYPMILINTYSCYEQAIINIIFYFLKLLKMDIVICFVDKVKTTRDQKDSSTKG